MTNLQCGWETMNQNGVALTFTTLPNVIFLWGFIILYLSHLHENLTHKKKLYQPQAVVET